MLRVELSACDDARRAVFSVLAGPGGLSQAQARRLAGLVAVELRANRLLSCSLEQHFKASEVALLVSRSLEHVVQQAKAGEFGQVMRDAGGWLIPASGVQAWLDRRAVKMEAAA